jgi:alpha-tubulin suppressor-like RCC1 family protein
MRARGVSRLGGALLFLVVAVAILASPAPADQSSQPMSPAAGRIATGKYHSCAVLSDGSVRCWGYGANGQLGYGNPNNVGDDETPVSAGPVNLGPGRTAMAISAGDYHTCALLDDGTVRCWGYGAEGRLGYGNANNVGVTDTPASVGPVDLGAGHTAKAISAGGAHTCAILDDGSVRCWGFGFDGRLGYGSSANVADTPATTPANAGPVNLGPGRTAVAISSGGSHTCAILDEGSVRCWGYGNWGQLGYGSRTNVGDAPTTTPDKVGPVDLGPGRTAKAIGAGTVHSCALLDDGTVRCWGFGGNGQLGYGNTESVGYSQTPGSTGPLNLGPGHTAVAITAGGSHTCAILDDQTVRCWGYNVYGQLGYASTADVGDTPATTPDKLGPVDLGSGRKAVAISAGALHTCALLDNSTVRCWGYGANGRLGYCSEANVGATQTPGKTGPVNLKPGDGGIGCGGGQPDPRRVEAARAKAWHGCLAAATRRPKPLRGRARGNCVKRYARTPGRVTALRTRAVSNSTIVLTFLAPGSDGSKPPAARAYLVKQSLGPIHGAREFQLAQALCHGSCRFNVSTIGTKVKLTITHLLPHTTYYYAIAARDNVTGTLGPRSISVATKTR